MKQKVIKKEMQSQFDKIVSVGFCDLQHLLQYESPFAYNAGVYGWNCDFYVINGVLISTGYSPIPSKRTKSDYYICKRYDDKAEEILCDYNLSYMEQREKVTELLYKYIEEVA